MGDSPSPQSPRRRPRDRPRPRAGGPGDLLELGNGPMFVLQVVDLVETGPDFLLAALVQAAPATTLVR